MRNVKHLAICGCTARFMFDLVGNPEDGFSYDVAHMDFMKGRVTDILDMTSAVDIM